VLAQESGERAADGSVAYYDRARLLGTHRRDLVIADSRDVTTKRCGNRFDEAEQHWIERDRHDPDARFRGERVSIASDAPDLLHPDDAGEPAKSAASHRAAHTSTGGSHRDQKLLTRSAGVSWMDP
jgi:hypothetical protein